MTRPFRYFLVVLWAVAALGFTAAADTLYLRAGEQEPGRLKQMTPDAVIFEGRDGEKTLPKSEVTRIELQRARRFDDVESVAQIQDPDLRACIEKQPAEKDFPADGSVTLLQRKTYDLTQAGVVKETNRTITKILRQRGEGAGSVNVWHFEDTDTADIDFALTVTPDGRVLHLSDAALKTESIFARLPDYRRLARLRFACKEPRPGSILDVQYTVVRKRDPVLEPFYAEEVFRNRSPILHKEVIVMVPEVKIGDAIEPADVVRYEVFNAGAGDAAALEFSRDNVGTTGGSPAGVKSCRLVWKLAQPQPGIVDEPLMPPLRAFVPTLTLAAAARWPEIIAAYAKALDGVAPLSDALKAKAAELNGQGGPAAIYNFVARGIRTAPVAHGQFRVVPHAPDETVKRGIANELDKNFLYLKLLEAVGVPCAFALVRDRGQGPLSPAAPSIRAFDRSAVYLMKEKIFSNGSSDLLAFGMLAGDLQHTPALVIAPGNKGPTMTQPGCLEREVAATQFDAALGADGDLDITLTYTAQGNAAAGIRTLKELDEQQLRNQLEQMAGNLHPAAVLKDYKTSDLADLAAPPELRLHCAIPGYAITAGDLMLFNLPAIAYSAGEVGRPTREHDLFWPQVDRDTTEGAIHLPKGFRVYAAPDHVKFNSAIVAYRAKLKKKGDGILFRGRFDLKVPEAARDAYPQYKRCKEIRAGLARQRVILIRDKGSNKM
jgi:hypothetical protein